MHYVISDIHGCFEKYLKMLDLIGLAENDSLFVLGDVIDRGDEGVPILLDMMRRKNVVPVTGNHEAMAAPVMRLLTDGRAVTRDANAYLRWMQNGGLPTFEAFRALDPQTRRDVADYISSFSVYETISVGGRRFHLSHTLPGYDPDKDIHDATYKEFIWGEPDYDETYDEKMLFVTGHTPTGLIDPSYAGRIYIKNNHIAIDCGAVFDGGRLGCVRLEDLAEFYV